MRSFVAALLVTGLLAGCANDQPDDLAPAPQVGAPLLDDVLNTTLQALGGMAFTPHVVTAAVDMTGDLYEPTIEVSESGVIYITGHTILVDTTGAPVYSSHDDGRTWAQLPFLQALAMPGPVQGATPPPSDEIFLSAGDDGWLFGVDITLATFPVNAWSHDGRVHAYHNPNAYDETKAQPQTERGCVPAPAKDRPWGAYENGTLLMVSNPGAGPAQVGVMRVPPARSLGVGAPADDIEWNLCAGPGTTPASCSIPGVPDISFSGRFAVPQLCETGVLCLMDCPEAERHLYFTMGDAANVLATNVVPVFPVDSRGEITSYYGHAAFDANGTLFAGITNNTWHVEQRNGTDRLGRPTVTNVTVPDDGGLAFAVSTDGGETFANRTYRLPGGPMRHFYMDANEKGPGALVVWAVDGAKNANNQTIAWDWYVGHLQLGMDGFPELTGVFLAIDDGPRPSAHVTGAAVGPDGRAYLAMYTGGAEPGSTALPLSVYVQRAGPTLPAWS